MTAEIDMVGRVRLYGLGFANIVDEVGQATFTRPAIAAMLSQPTITSSSGCADPAPSPSDGCLRAGSSAGQSAMAAAGRTSPP